MRTANAVQEFLASCTARGHSPDTIAAYRWALAHLVKANVPTPAAPGHVEQVLASVSIAPTSRQDLFRVIRTFYRWTEQRYGHPNPTKDMPMPRARRRLPRVLSEAEAQRVLSLAPSRRDLGLCAAALDTGVRVGELARLSWPDIATDTARVSGKTGQRDVPLSPEVRRLLVGLGDGHHVWTGRQGPLTRSGVEQTIRNCLATAGVHPPKAGPHTLRHTFGYMYVKNGGNAFALQRIMGHSSIQTTMLYVTMQTADLVEQHAKASPVRHLWSIPMGRLLELREEAHRG